MSISLIAAADSNNTIGLDGMIPWERVPADMKHLKDLCRGNVIIMGSETLRSMIKYKSSLLSDCKVVVLTRSEGQEFLDQGFEVAHSIDESLEMAKAHNTAGIYILGGATVYEQSMEKADAIYLTRIHDEFEGDTWFPEISEDQWEEVSREEHTADDKNPYDYTFLTYKRK